MNTSMIIISTSGSVDTTSKSTYISVVEHHDFKFYK